MISWNFFWLGSRSKSEGQSILLLTKQTVQIRDQFDEIQLFFKLKLNAQFDSILKSESCNVFNFNSLESIHKIKEIRVSLKLLSNKQKKIIEAVPTLTMWDDGHDVKR